MKENENNIMACRNACGKLPEHFGLRRCIDCRIATLRNRLCDGTGRHRTRDSEHCRSYGWVVYLTNASAPMRPPLCRLDNDYQTFRRI